MSTPHTPDAVASAQEPPSRERTWLTAFLLPLVLFGVLSVVLGVGLFLNPREIPSPLIGKPVPEFDLSPVKGRTQGLASRDLRGDVSLVNVFASWCVGPDGRIANKHIGPMTSEFVRDKLLPMIEGLRR